MTNNSQGNNNDHQKKSSDATAHKMIEKINEMLSGSDEGWESSAENKDDSNQNESPDYVPTEDKVVRDTETGEKKVIKDENK